MSEGLLGVQSDEQPGESLLSMAQEAEKAAGNAANPKIEEAWLKIAKRYRDLAAKQPRQM